MATIALDIGGTKIASAIFFPDGSMMFKPQNGSLKRKKPVTKVGKARRGYPRQNFLP